MALTGWQVDWEMAKLGAAPVGRALSGLAKKPEKADPSIYSGANLNRPSGLQPPAEASPVKPATITSPSTPVTLTGTPKISVAGKPAIDINTPDKPQSMSVKEGWSSTPNANVHGGRVLSMGRPGDPNSGTGYVSGPARQPVDINAIARSKLSGTATIQGTNGPYSFEGTGADAARFSRPVATPARVVMGETTGGDYRQVREQHEAARSKLSGAPQYLGPESGLGWKSRIKKYEADLDAYNKDKGNATSMSLEAMREAGAGQRSLLAAQGENDRNAIARNRLGMEAPGIAADTVTKQLEAAAKVDLLTAQQEYTKNPSKENEAKLRALTTKFGETKQQTVQMIDVPLDPTNPTSETVGRPARINEDGTYTMMAESGKGNAPAPTAAPKQAIDDLKKNPNLKDQFFKKYGYLPQ